MTLTGETFMTLATVPVLSHEGGLSRYINEIRRFPVLTLQEEQSLAQLWRKKADVRAAHKLVTSHLRLVVKIAMGYRGYGLPVAEIVSEGNVGLMQAVKKFEPEKGFRLSTYAMWWIKASIQEYILRSWSLVKIGTTAAQKKLFFGLRKAKSKISALEEGDMNFEQVESLATKFGVTNQEVIDMNRRLSGDMSLNTPYGEESESQWQDTLEDQGANQETLLIEHEEQSDRMVALRRGLEVLNPRERRVFEARRLMDDPMTLETLAEEFNVSRERIRQIETRAFEKVQEAVKSHIEASHTPLLMRPEKRPALTYQR
jgi:RNA polymerase sigma-32 factor